jgi:hypothetical protein
MCKNDTFLKCEFCNNDIQLYFLILHLCVCVCVEGGQVGGEDFFVLYDIGSIRWNPTFQTWCCKNSLTYT